MPVIPNVELAIASVFHSGLKVGKANLSLEGQATMNACDAGNILEELIRLLRLEKIEENIFRGQSQDLGFGNVFGGQVLGQALSAASQTVPDGRHAHSLHGYFMRVPGMSASPSSIRWTASGTVKVSLHGVLSPSRGDKRSFPCRHPSKLKSPDWSIKARCQVFQGPKD